MLQRRKLWLCTGLIVCLLLGLSASSVFAQSATLKGKVTDAQSGEGLGANVTVTAQGVRSGASCDAKGLYTVPNLAPGTYTVTVSILSYETQVQTVTLRAGETKVLNIGLTEAGIEFNAVVVSASRTEQKVLQAPAAISLVEQTEIRREVSPSATGVLRNLTGIDMAKTGIDREEIVLRGFNNAFSGATYVLTDYRQAAVASLGVNLYSIMPNNSIDLDRVEIVRGPGSALYGAGVDAGVIHYFSQDPFAHPGTSVTLGGGERALYNGAFRHAGVIGGKFGYKFTGNYAQANDWELDSNDPLDKVQLASDKIGFKRNYDYEKYNVNAMFEYRLKEGVALIANGGHSALDATVLSGIGTVQAVGFGYSYAQMRLQARNFFTQAYINRNDAGDSFVYGSGNYVVDKSRLINLQAQYDFSFSQERHKVIIGADYDQTTPDTKGTIYGRNENDDQISELGGYVQTTSAVSPKFDLTLAMRADYNNIQEDLQLSPRVAMVLKATTEHTFRATYNRAFSSPGNNSNFLDIVAREPDARLPIRIRGRGAAKGFTFEHNAAYTAFAGTDLVATSLNPAALGQPQPVGLPLDATYASVHAGLAAIPIPTLKALLPPPLNQLPDAQVAGLVALLAPANTKVNGFSKGVLGLLNPTTGAINPVSGVTDIDPLKPTISQTMELGYKGVVSKRVLFAVDAYYTNKKNFVGPLLMETPFVLVPKLSSDLTAALAAGIDANAVLKGALGQAGVTPAAAAALIVGLASRNLPSATTPVAIVAPKENSVGVGKAPELLLSYRNFGNINYYGIDATLQIMANNRLNFFGNMSYVSDDFFDNEELDEAGTSLELALNAPKFKAKGGFAYNVPLGISFNGSARYTNGFPVRSGPYNGNVEDYFLIDIGAGYDFGKTVRGMTVNVAVQNLLNDKHREFIGAPKIGRLATAQLSLTF